MKKLILFLMMSITVFITGCTNPNTVDLEKDFVFNEIDFYMENNLFIDTMFKTGLDDIEPQTRYQKNSFFNYNLKSSNNVDVEYDEYYEAFNTLFLVKHIIDEVEDFEFDTCYTETISTERLCLYYINEVLQIEYYEHIDDLGISIGHHFDLLKENDQVIMTKYTRIFDHEAGIEILRSKRYVKGYDLFIHQVFYPQTDSFNYEYVDYLNQDYFMYKGVLNNDLEFIRQTVEIYDATNNAFVSYDIKEDVLEDYRVKLFKEGHRVLKLDVNIKTNNPTINEFTWNLLSLEGWTEVVRASDVYYIYNNSTKTLSDYFITVQLNGYGKVNAYIMYEGEITSESITLENYGLTTGYTLSDIESARTTFETNYIDLLSLHGFVSNSPENRLVVYNEVSMYNEDFMFFVNKFE